MKAMGISHPVRVLVVDDSAFMRAALSRMISSDRGLEVIATACSGADAIDKIECFNPDVVTLDVQMPGVDGLETLRHIMSRFPRPVVMVSAVTENDAETTFDALSAGAFDYVPKQMSSASLDITHIRSDLLAKIRAAAIAGRSSRLMPSSKAIGGGRLDRTLHTETLPALVAIGASTGGPKALEEILPRFPRDLPVPILIVQHMPIGFTASFAARLDRLSTIEVKEARHGDVIRQGVAYIAPAGVHMRARRQQSEPNAVITLDRCPPDANHIPSIDVLMTSVAEVYRRQAVGVVMTGMGCDGAEGMKAIYQEGGFTIGQDEASCAVYGMSRTCAERGVLKATLSLEQIPTSIIDALRCRV
jgi:two-component system chemotaxis response regulator CheB